MNQTPEDPSDHRIAPFAESKDMAARWDLSELFARRQDGREAACTSEPVSTTSMESEETQAEAGEQTCHCESFPRPSTYPAGWDVSELYP